MASGLRAAGVPASMCPGGPVRQPGVLGAGMGAASTRAEDSPVTQLTASTSHSRRGLPRAPPGGHLHNMLPTPQPPGPRNDPPTIAIKLYKISLAPGPFSLFISKLRDEGP